MEETKEYSTFSIQARDGRQLEMAVVDEFDYAHHHYLVAALIEGDTISDEGQYLYRCKLKEDSFEAEEIRDAEEFAAVTKAYLEMEEAHGIL